MGDSVGVVVGVDVAKTPELHSASPPRNSGIGPSSVPTPVFDMLNSCCWKPPPTKKPPAPSEVSATLFSSPVTGTVKRLVGGVVSMST